MEATTHSGNQDGPPPPDGTRLSRSGPLRKSMDDVFQTTTRRLQLKSVWAQLTLDRYTAAMAIKASIPPAVLMCAIESNTWINHFKTNAYLAPIISACAMPALPRARLIEYHLQLAFAFAVSYCWALLAGWSGLQARKHTTDDVGEFEAYNSSAEAVVAIFFIFLIWCTFTLKSAVPSWGLQCTLAGILAVATIPNVARASSMQEVINTTSNTLQSFLAGQAVGFVNALVIFPQSCRGVFKQDMKACLDKLVDVMRAQRRCIDDFGSSKISVEGEDERSSSVSQLEGALQHFINSVVKAREGVTYAKREVFWDRLGHSQLENIASLLVDLIPPASGLSSTAHMLRLAIDRRHHTSNGANGANGHLESNNSLGETEDWYHLQETMQQHSTRISEAIIEGVEHARCRLKLTNDRSLFRKIHARKSDEENQIFSMNPGEASFLSLYREVFDNCCIIGQEHDGVSEQKLLDYYIRHRPQVGDRDRLTPEAYSDTLRYFLLLHSQTLLSSLGDELLKLLLVIEECHASPKHLHFPRPNQLIHWLKGFGRLGQDSDDQVTDIQSSVELGPAFYKQKNPDHLEPANLFEIIGENCRKISSVFSTSHAAYGLRGVCAIMSIAVIAFLRESQNFYFQQRFIWALFAILLSMGRTAGSSTFLLLARILGTTLSMIANYIIWYIVDEKIPGILVLLWLWFIFIGYLFIRFPTFFSIWFVALVATIIMTATELQVRRLGEETVLESGQAVYAPYIIFPFRLAVVTLGVLTGYFWTIFPYPLSEHYELRQDVAKAMYMLANFYMCIRQIIFARIHGTAGNPNDKTSPSFHLQTARRRVFRKYQTLSTGAKTYFQFLDWEFALGGRFPKQDYGEILSILDRLGSYMTLTGYVSRALSRSPASSSWWTIDQTGTAQNHLTIEGFTTRMIILHSALSGSHALPPQLHEFKIPDLSKFLSRDIPSEEGFAAAALIHNVNWYLIHDLNRLTRLVKDLVGELDFSFTVDPEKFATPIMSDRFHDGGQGGSSLPGEKVE